MKNKNSKRFSAVLASRLLAVCLCLSASAEVLAQSRNIYNPDPLRDSRLAVQPGAIEQGTLGAPTAYEAGVIDIRTGGLDPNLWQGTSAALATNLIEKTSFDTTDPLVRDMLIAALLSSGIPPEGDLNAVRSYNAVKLSAISKIADLNTLETQINRSGSSVRTPIFQAELALRKGDISRACGLSDTVTEGRADIFWLRLRTLCHLNREEFSAAELTTDLLQNNGYSNDRYFSLVRVLSGATKTMPKPERGADPIDQALYTLAAASLDMARAEQAFDANADPELRLAALLKFSDQLTDMQIVQVFSDLAFDVNDPEGSSSFDFESARARKTAQGTAQLFLLARSNGNVQSAVPAFFEILKRSPNEIFKKRLIDILSAQFQSWPIEAKIESGLDLFARRAVEMNDSLELRNLYSAMPEGTKKSRLTLAIAALENSFLLAPMGPDIDERLARENEETSQTGRSVRDALLALALGAQISDTALNVLPTAEIQTGRKISEGEKAVLKANAKARQTAQFILRLAPLIEGETLSAPDIAFVVEQLHAVGLPDFAGRLAAQDFLAPL